MPRRIKPKFIETLTYPELDRSMRWISGSVSELRVACDLFLKGYYVFWALSPRSPFDLVGYKDGKLTRFEVRTGSLLRSGKINAVRTHRADVLAIALTSQIIYEPPLEVPDGQSTTH